MMAGDQRAQKVFVDDFQKTYAHVVNRVKITAEEAAAAGGRQQIQLVATNPEQTISFNVPDGPPPENLVLEGPGTEGMDIEEVRKVLQMRWDVFDSFDEELKACLREGSLEKVNLLLGEMSVEDAEIVVRNLDMTGILNFTEGGIRDATGQVPVDDED